MIIGGYRNCGAYAIAVLVLGHINILCVSLYGNILGINFGGGILPVALSLYLLYRLRAEGTGWLYTFLASLVFGIVITYGECRFVPESGIKCSLVILPFFLAVIIHVLVFMEPRIDLKTKLVLGFACATLGRLIGSDFLYLREVISSVTGHSYALGGSGICDGIFLAGPCTVALVISIEILGRALKNKLSLHTA